MHSDNGEPKQHLLKQYSQCDFVSSLSLAQVKEPDLHESTLEEQRYLCFATDYDAQASWTCNMEEA
jgi:hypothetical protein